MRVPKDEVSTLALQKGTKFGFNVCLNETDLFDRDKFFEYTYGIGVTKRPSSYQTWTMTDAEPSTSLTGFDLPIEPSIEHNSPFAGK